MLFLNILSKRQITTVINYERKEKSKTKIMRKNSSKINKTLFTKLIQL